MLTFCMALSCILLLTAPHGNALAAAKRALRTLGALDPDGVLAELKAS